MSPMTNSAETSPGVIETPFGVLAPDMDDQEARNIVALVIVDDDDFEATSSIEWDRLEGEGAYTAKELYKLTLGWVLASPDSLVQRAQVHIYGRDLCGKSFLCIDWEKRQ